MAAQRLIPQNETAPAPPGATSQVADAGQADAVREALVHAARIQLASITAVSRFFAGWAQAADSYIRALSDELLDRLDGETAPGELIGRLAAVSSLHLRELTALPNAAVSHFNSELTKPPTAAMRGRPGAGGGNRRRSMRPSRATARDKGREAA